MFVGLRETMYKWKLEKAPQSLGVMPRPLRDTVTFKNSSDGLEERNIKILGDGKRDTIDTEIQFFLNNKWLRSIESEIQLILDYNLYAKTKLIHRD